MSLSACSTGRIASSFAACLRASAELSTIIVEIPIGESAPRARRNPRRRRSSFRPGITARHRPSFATSAARVHRGRQRLRPRHLLVADAHLGSAASSLWSPPACRHLRRRRRCAAPCAARNCSAASQGRSLSAPANQQHQAAHRNWRAPANSAFWRGGDAVVHPGDAGDRAHGLQSMLNWLELLYRLAHDFRHDARSVDR